MKVYKYTYILTPFLPSFNYFPSSRPLSWHTKLSISSSSCCLSVSYKAAFLVLGYQILTQQTTNNWQCTKNYKAKQGLKRPNTSNKGDLEAPNIKRCLSIETEKFLTFVGKSSKQCLGSWSGHKTNWFYNQLCRISFSSNKIFTHVWNSTFLPFVVW